MTTNTCSVEACTKKYYGKGYCEKHYQRVRKTGSPEDKTGHHVALVDKFFKRVEKTEDCWNWAGPKRKGYGHVWANGKTVRAHRASWMLVNGKIPDGLFVGTKLEKIEIPNSVTSIGSLAFSETELTEIQVPDSVTQIYMKTFSGNLKLVSVSLPDSLLGIWGDAFDRAYALTTISYCGMAKLPTLIIPTTCPPERKAVIYAKLAADKLAADKVDLQARINSASAALAQLDAEVDSLMKQYPSMKAELILYKKKIALFANLNQQNLGTAELNLVSLISKLNSVKLTYKKIARGITCVKGNRTLKVVDVKPKCPAGYRKK